MDILDLNSKTRQQIWKYITDTIEEYNDILNHGPVCRQFDFREMQSEIASITFDQRLDPFKAIDFIIAGLWNHQLHTPHPKYFGLFNPAPSTMGIVADTLVATFNPQLATCSHSPFAIELEQQLIRLFASRIGYDVSMTDGTFTSGGSEANYTAIFCGLMHKFPKYAKEGLRGLEKQPTLYISEHCHPSFIKAARSFGLGTDAVREIPVDNQFKMNIDALAKQIESDKKNGFIPFLVVATAGTPKAGVIDPLQGVAYIADREKLWFHVDAAWGGLVLFVPELYNLIAGIDQSSSITLDPHKWLSIPMGAGLFITRYPNILGETFDVSADFMPRSTSDHTVEPFKHSIQWSRRFIGLKVYLSLAVAGWDGYAQVIRHQIKMCGVLKQKLEASDWKVLNKTQLPIVCFSNMKSSAENNSAFIETMQRKIVASGEAWISSTFLNNNTPVLRACITNYRTQEEDIFALIDALNKTRRNITCQ